MKRFISLILTLCIISTLFTALPSTAYAIASGTCGDNLTWELDDNGTLTISGTGDMWNYKYYSLVPTGACTSAPWRHEFEKIKKIIIEDGVTSIGDFAFYWSYHKAAIKSVTIPDSVTYIGEMAFTGGVYATDLTIPKGVKYIGDGAFQSSDITTSVIIPDSVTYLGERAFAYCDSLKSVVIGKGIKTLNRYVFSGCDKLINVTIPYSVTNIGYNAFGACRSLTSITIPSSVTSIDEDAFWDCYSLTDVYYTGSESKWANVSIHPDGNYYLINATMHYYGLPDPTPEPTPTPVPDYFCGDNLTWELDDYGTLTVSGTGDMWDFEPDENWESTSAPWYSSINKIKNVVIEDGVTSIGNYAFWWGEALKSVSIGDSVTSIGDYAFNLCYNLTRLTIPDSVKNIGEAAFYCCYNLKSINIGSSVEVIGKSAFVCCEQLTSITVPDSVKTISPSAFLACASVKKVIIGKGVTSIGLAAFEECYNLTDVFYSGNKSEWSGVEIGNQNEYLINATMHFSDSNFTNGTSSAVTKVYATAFSPSNDSVLSSNKIDIKINLNTTVKAGNGKIRIKDYKTDKEVLSFNVSGLSFSGNTASLSGVSLESGKSYYIAIDSGAILSQSGVPFYGINDKSVWHFSTENVSTKNYVSLKYPQKGSLWWKSDDTDFPPIPSDNLEEYKNELTAWAKAYNVDSVASASDMYKILDMSVKIPITDVNGQTFLLNDNGTTVKQVMQDLIFIENLKPYIEKIDKKLEATKEDSSYLTDYNDEADLYNMAQSYTVQLEEYINSRYGKGKSSFFLSVAAPLAYQALIKTVTNGLGSQESSLVKTIADATVQTNALKSDISTISGASDYAEYKQGLSDIKNYTKLGKELYKITTGGVSKSTVKCGIDMLNLYFSDNGIGQSNEALNMISQAWSQIQSSKSAIQMCMFLGNSLGFFPFVLDLYTKGNKKLADETKAWYFIADYYLDEKYPGLLDLVYDENGYALKSDYDSRNPETRVTENYYDEIQNDIILRKWAKLIDVTGLINNNTKNIINTRRDMVNAVNVFRFAKAVDVEEVKESLLNYISAELSRGKTTEVYGMCPILINVYDKDYNLVASLSSEDENDINTEYGSFYLLGDDKDTKYFILSSDEYTMEILPYADGEMTVAINQRDENGEITETAYYENVPIKEGEYYHTDLSGGVLIKKSEELEELEQNEAKAESIEIISSDDECEVYNGVTLSCELYPEYTADKTIEWSVDSDKVELYDLGDGNCAFVPMEPGTYTVTAKSNGLTATKEIKVYTFIEEIYASVSEIAMISGEEYTPKITVIPETDRPLKWTTSDPNVASVDEDGTITARAAGEATIIAVGGKSDAKIQVTVSESVLDILAYQSDTEGDRIKLDIKNMSCTEDFSGDTYIGIYHEGSLVRFVKYPISLLRQESLTDYIDVELGGKDYEVKLFLWSENLEPLQQIKEMKLLSNIEE